jgi:hypothetical protein
VPANPYSARYMATKHDKLGHFSNQDLAAFPSISDPVRGAAHPTTICGDPPHGATVSLAVPTLGHQQ